MPFTRIIRNHGAPVALAAAMLGASATAIVLPRADAATKVQPVAAAAPNQTVLDHVNRRLGSLKQRLEITHEQEGAWHAFAQVSRENATAMAKLYDQRAQHIGTMNAVQNMESYAAIQARQADDMNKLSAAFQTLYGKLTPPQQHKVDAMFRIEAERHLHHRRATKHD